MTILSLELHHRTEPDGLEWIEEIEMRLIVLDVVLDSICLHDLNICLAPGLLSVPRQVQSSYLAQVQA